MTDITNPGSTTLHLLSITLHMLGFNPLSAKKVYSHCHPINIDLLVVKTLQYEGDMISKFARFAYVFIQILPM